MKNYNLFIDYTKTYTPFTYIIGLKVFLHDEIKGSQFNFPGIAKNRFK